MGHADEAPHKRIGRHHNLRHHMSHCMSMTGD
jgi:hypothetical protein